jgi:hypothetical protein
MMNLSKYFFGLVGVILATYCATSNADPDIERMDFLRKRYEQCFIEIGRNPALIGIANKVALEKISNPNTSFDMLSNGDLPTDDEKKLILKWGKEKEQCLNLKAEHNAMFPPILGQILVDSDNQQQMLVIELYAGKLSYGEFAAKRQEIDSRTKAQFQQAIGQLEAGFAQYEYQNRQLQIQRQQNEPKPYQMPQMPRHTQTQSVCGWQGSQWVCTTR